MALFVGASWSFCFSRKLQKPRAPPKRGQILQTAEAPKALLYTTSGKAPSEQLPELLASLLPSAHPPPSRSPPQIRRHPPPSLRAAPPAALLLATFNGLHPSSARRPPPPELRPPATSAELHPTDPPSTRALPASTRAPTDSTRAHPDVPLHSRPASRAASSGCLHPSSARRSPLPSSAQRIHPRPPPRPGSSARRPPPPGSPSHLRGSTHRCPLPSARLARPTPLLSAWTASPPSSPKAPLEKLPQTAQLAFSKS